MSIATFITLFSFGLVWAILAVRLSGRYPVYSVVGLAIVTAVVLIASTQVQCRVPQVMAPKPSVELRFDRETKKALKRLRDDVSLWSGQSTPEEP